MVDFLSALEEPTRNDSLTISTSSVSVADRRTNLNPRKVVLIRNISGNGNRATIFMSSLVATANQGIVLEDGESFTDSSDSGYQCHQGSIQAIGSAANTVLSIFER
jgi:hypothetical protein